MISKTKSKYLFEPQFNFCINIPMNNSYLIPFSAFNALPTKKSVSSDADTFFESWNNRPFQLRQFLTELEKVDGFGDILLGNSHRLMG